MPTGGRTPPGNRSAASRCDGPTAPTAGPRSGPPSSTVNLGLNRFRVLRLDLFALDVLTPLSLALPPSSPVCGAPAGCHAHDCADEAPETRHNEFWNPRCMRCIGWRSWIAALGD